VSARRLPLMFAARPGSTVNGYALPFAAASAADLLAAGSRGLTLAARGFLPCGRAGVSSGESARAVRGVLPPEEDCAAVCATRQA